ncbi:Calcineurin subunit B [Auxenochlorella protothecoides]|uniref:Calcineurin subunit B n=1 Tax=Auxenochlorella protothecoides TaxID=3075 RepID=A0A087SML3_AUXPR|nr:Calcineurin subunit B [Auxenochlorella protothecoides]KFM26967.1 Calcineurin subunit B [Auxenochlorella protothecoides]RMZ56618.1 hypothetical protein APUTEX25_002707 [Auxenochlorella protothecoides]|eukprot:RMZ56618.1 hypothetical protein APUTEX25_002707 [Auxenochlorella protothecoides]
MTQNLADVDLRKRELAPSRHRETQDLPLANLIGEVDQQEIEALYKRFRRLDKDRKGFISSEEFLSIPELSINPLAQRLSFFVESINFKEFVTFLSGFSAKAGREEKLKVMFDVYDVDGDGFISEDDMAQTLRYLIGSTLAEAELRSVIERTMVAAGADAKGLTFAQYKEALGDTQLALNLEVPTGD